MNIIAVYRNQVVEVTDFWTSGGIEYASVKAIEGEPFVGGNKQPVHTAFTIALVDELKPIEQPIGIFILARDYARARRW